jgi:hypothetical protein
MQKFRTIIKTIIKTRIIIIIIILLLLIYYLYNKNKEYYTIISDEYQDSISNIYSLILNNQLMPINSIKVSKTLDQDINGTKLNVGTNIIAKTLNTTNLKVNNLIANAITMEESNISEPIVVNNICDTNNNCLTKTDINMLNLLENPIINRMYLSDALNCKIFNNLNLIKYENQNSFKILSVGLGKNLMQDLTSKPFFVNNKIGLFYDPQNGLDALNNIGFNIYIPTPNQLGFIPSVLWVEVYSTSIIVMQISDGVNFTNQHILNQNNYNIISPDGNITQNLYKVNDQPMWIPMPFNYDTILQSIEGKRLILTRTDASNNPLRISGMAFSTNPWNHLNLHAFNIMNNTYKLLNDMRKNSPAMATGSEILNSEYTIFRNTTGPTNPSNIIVRIPVINSGSDKILYLITHNDIRNENMKAVYIFQKSDVQPTISNSKDLTTATFNDISNNPMIRLDNFTTTFNNPFSRHYNSSVYNRYIGTVIPSNLITSNFIIVGLQLPIAINTHPLVGTRIKNIGTHDKIPII